MTYSEIPQKLQLGSRNGVGHMKIKGLSEIGFDREKMPSEPPQPAMAKESRGRVKSSSRANFHPYGWRMQGFPTAPVGPPRNGVGNMKTHDLSEIGFDRTKIVGRTAQMATAERAKIASIL